MKIEIYSDGSATTAANSGGWASVIVIDGVKHKELSGYLSSATNNDAELLAALNGLEYVYNSIIAKELPVPTTSDTVTLISDSEIVLNWTNGKYRFKQVDKLPLYEKLRFIVKTLDVQTKWVRGHSGDPWNERCDRLANLARKQVQESTGPEVENKVQSAIGGKKAGVACIWYQGSLRVLDFEQGIIETYNRDAHGKRGSVLEIRENK